MQPKTTNEFLDAISSKEGGASDYRLAQLLGCSKQIVSNYRHKRVAFGDEIAIRAAQLLDLDPAYVVMCVHRERAKTDTERALWSSMLEKLGGLAASLALVVICAAPTPSHAGIGAIQSSCADSYCFQKRRERLLTRLSQIFGFRLTGL